MPAPREWYSIRNAGDVAEIAIYDGIGGGFGEGTSAKSFMEQLRAITASQITLRLNSEGGDVFDGLAIYNTLKAHPARVTVRIDGIAASIASVVAMAGDEIRMARNGFMMIHDASGLVIGSAVDMRKMAEAMEKIDSKLAETYAARTGRAVEEFRARMTAETWFTAEEAQALGMIDAIDGESAEMPRRAAACLQRYRRVPQALSAAALLAAAIPTNQKENDMPIGICTLPDGTTKESDQEACDADGGTWEEMHEEEAAAQPATKNELPSAKADDERAATLAELKAALPTSSAEFREACIEHKLTLTAALGECVRAQTTELHELREKLARHESGGRAVPFTGGRTLATTGADAEMRQGFEAQVGRLDGIKNFEEFVQLEKKIDAAFARH